MIIHHLDDTILPFDQRGTAFHPITAIVIRYSAELPDRCAVDMAAQDGIDRELLRVMHDLLFESANETDRIFDVLFSERAERPVTEAEPAADEVDERIQREQKLVSNVACERQPFHVLHYGIKLMPVDDEHAAAARQTMDRMPLHGDIAVSAEKAGEHFVVITRYVNDARAFARFTEDFLDNVVVLLRPVTAAAQLPDVDQIAHHIESLAFVLAQEVEQRAGIAAACAQMDI